MAWNVEFLDSAKWQLRKIDKHWQRAILDYLEDEIAPLEDPRSRGKALVGDKRGLWRYRVGDYRILCEIRDAELVIAACHHWTHMECIRVKDTSANPNSIAKLWQLIRQEPGRVGNSLPIPKGLKRVHGWPLKKWASSDALFIFRPWA